MAESLFSGQLFKDGRVMLVGSAAPWVKSMTVVVVTCRRRGHLRHSRRRQRVVPLVVQDSKSLEERSESNLSSSSSSSNSCWLCSLFSSAMGAAGSRPVTVPAQNQRQQSENGSATVVTASKPAQLPEQLQSTTQHQQNPADCLGCRVTGLMLGLGGAGYVSSRLFEHPKPKGAHRLTLISVSVGLFALGISRALGL